MEYSYRVAWICLSATTDRKRMEGLESARLDGGPMVDFTQDIQMGDCSPGLEPHRGCTRSDSDSQTGTEGQLVSKRQSVV